MAAIIPSKYDNLRLTTCQILIRPQGKRGFVEIEAVSAFTYKSESEKAEAYARDSGVKRLVATQPISEKVTGSIEALDYNDLVRLMEFCDADGATRFLTRPAGQGSSVIPVADLSLRDAYALGFHPTNVEVSANSVPLEEGVDYKVRASKSGNTAYVQFLILPTHEVTITWDEAAITAADKKRVIAFYAGKRVTGELHAVGTNLSGTQNFVKLWTVEFEIEEGSGMGGDEFTSVNISFEARYDSSKALRYGSSDFGYGEVLDA